MSQKPTVYLFTLNFFQGQAQIFDQIIYIFKSNRQRIWFGVTPAASRSFFLTIDREWLLLDGQQAI